MGMKKLLISATLAAGIAASGTLVASPAEATVRYWNKLWWSNIDCQRETNRKIHTLHRFGYTVRVMERCGLHRDVADRKYYRTNLRYAYV